MYVPVHILLRMQCSTVVVRPAMTVPRTSWCLVCKGTVIASQTKYSGTSDSGLSQIRTMYDEPPYKGHNLMPQTIPPYNSTYILNHPKETTSLQRTNQLNLCCPQSVL